MFAPARERSTYVAAERSQSVVAAAWAALDDGRALATDAEAWRALEGRVVLLRP